MAFEMLGMVGIVFQINRTAFRMLPNPTIYHWDRKSFSTRALLLAYTCMLDKAAEYEKQDAQGSAQNTHMKFRGEGQIQKIISAAKEIEKGFKKSESRQQEQDGFMTASPKTMRGTEEPRLYCKALITTLHTAIANCDKFLKDHQQNSVVQTVLRVHLQEVMAMLNMTDTDVSSAEDGCEKTDALEEQPKTTDHSSDFYKDGKKKMTYKYGELLLSLKRLDSTSHEERHTILMGMYVSLVREIVVQRTCADLNKERTSQKHGNQSKSIQRTRAEQEDKEQLVNEIWCVLVFRMLCWLLLHDFHRMDVHIERDEFFESRLPVYIA